MLLYLSIFFLNICNLHTLFHNYMKQIIKLLVYMRVIQMETHEMPVLLHSTRNSHYLSTQSPSFSTCPPSINQCHDAFIVFLSHNQFYITYCTSISIQKWISLTDTTDEPKRWQLLGVRSSNEGVGGLLQWSNHSSRYMMMTTSERNRHHFIFFTVGFRLSFRSIQYTVCFTVYCGSHMQKT
jgi:hypothetical protein